MIPDSEKAVLDAITIENPKIKILKKKRWVKFSQQSGYFIEDGHITKIRIIGSKKRIFLPDNFGNLKEHDIEMNNITSLPESFGNLVNLKELDLKMNNLTSLPESFVRESSKSPNSQFKF